MTNAQEIYSFLRGKGLTDAGALGLMGNLQAESGLFPCRLQGDYQDGFPMSKAYADRVDNGILPVDKAASDGLGWGLAQWTYPSRKKALLLFCLGNSVSIGNLQAQLDYLINELRRDYSGLNQYLCSTGDMYEATSRVCKEYERPAVNNIQQRYEYALGLKAVVADQTEPSDEPVEETFWPPRMLCTGMHGPDVAAMQGLLWAHGLTNGDPSGIRARLNSIAKQAEVVHVHPHRFRRTLATSLIDHGMQIQDVAAILGHDKLDTTLKYVYISKDNVKNAYRKFA